MKFGRIATILTLAFADVRVRAVPLIFDAPEKRTEHAFAGARVILAKDGLAAVDGQTIRLVRGRALVINGATIVSPFGRAACAGQCEALFTRVDEALTIETLSPGWTLTRTGAAARALPVATRTQISGVTRDGTAHVVAPTPLPWADLVTRWAKLYPDGPTKFAERVRAFRPEWQNAVTLLSDTAHDRALAMIETKTAADARAAARLKAEAAENAELRQLFRQKNFVE